MAKYNLDKYTSVDGLGFPLNFRRGNPNPLDNSSVWASLEAAQNYAANDPVAYVGQILTVVVTAEDSTTSVKAYSIQDEAGTLKEVGSVPVGDDLTIEVVDGKIQLKGAAAAETGAQPRIKSDGSIEWIVPSTETVDGLKSAVSGLQSDVSELQSDVADINTKIGTVSEGKTLVEMISDEATQAKTDAITAIMGEVGVDEKYDTLKEIADWILSDTTASAELITRVSNIEKNYLKGADKTELQGEIDALETFVGTLPESATSTNVVDYITEVVNGLKIGDYAKVADLTALADRVSTAETKIKALEDIGAEKNVIATVDTSQFAVDASRNLTLLDVAMSKVTGLQDALTNKVDKETGKSLVSDTLIAKLEAVENGAQANTIEQIKVGGTLLEIVDKGVNIPVATDTALGVVKSASDDNKVTVAADGTMEVNSVNVNKLTQDDADVLILDGGSAN